MSAEGEHAAEHHGPTVGQYLMIGLVLTIITVIEVWLSFADVGAVLIPALLIFSAVKFVIVVGWFMHLRYDSVFLTQLFVVGLVLGSGVLLALITLFWTDASDIVGYN
jgi:cytochrome c oxidase subunit 4